MAVQSLRFPLPEGSEWWRIMGGDLDTILDIANQIVELYDMPKVGYDRNNIIIIVIFYYF
jgi:hypothetical protein